jgi:ubiquinone/menaquinone biosynthesis C-methylase UbiE
MTSSFRDAELTGWIARAESYDKLFTPISSQAIAPILTKLGDVRGTRILDICCGAGHLTGALASHGAEAEGLDFSPTMVGQASANYSAIHFRQGDAECLPYDENSFDHAICCYGVMHFERPDMAIAEAHRVLRTGGKYIFTQWAKDDDLLRIVSSAITEHGDRSIDLPAAPPPMRFSDPEECRRVLLSSGFESVEVDRINIEWKSNRAEALLDLIYGSAVRAAMLIEAQQPARREKIHKAIISAARANSIGDVILIRRPTVMATGRKARPA